MHVIQTRDLYVKVAKCSSTQLLNNKNVPKSQFSFDVYLNTSTVHSSHVLVHWMKQHCCRTSLIRSSSPSPEKPPPRLYYWSQRTYCFQICVSFHVCNLCSSFSSFPPRRSGSMRTPQHWQLDCWTPLSLTASLQPSVIWHWTESSRVLMAQSHSTAYHMAKIWFT